MKNEETKRSCVFIGHYSPITPVCRIADSPAGNQVQRRIFDCLVRRFPGAVVGLNMPSASAFPAGPIIVSGGVEGGSIFLGYLNFPFIKHFFFALSLFFKLLVIRPGVCVQYNAFVFENLAVLLYRFFFRSAVVAAIIQDIHIVSSNPINVKTRIRNRMERIAVSVLRMYDLIVPVSAKIIEDFSLPRGKSFVFIGGTTAVSDRVATLRPAIEDYAVFAGKLERYNGVDRLVKAWSEQGLRRDLHVFGKGSLEGVVRAAAEANKYVIFHGQKDEDEIIWWQARARWNFCLRYSDQINQNYFFPSKFFNVCAAQGLVVANMFNGIPEELREVIVVVNDDLAGLGEIISHSVEADTGTLASKRWAILGRDYSWTSCVGKIIDRCVSPL